MYTHTYIYIYEIIQYIYIDIFFTFIFFWWRLRHCKTVCHNFRLSFWHSTSASFFGSNFSPLLCLHKISVHFDSSFLRLPRSREPEKSRHHLYAVQHKATSGVLADVMDDYMTLRRDHHTCMPSTQIKKTPFLCKLASVWPKWQATSAAVPVTSIISLPGVCAIRSVSPSSARQESGKVSAPNFLDVWMALSIQCLSLVAFNKGLLVCISSKSEQTCKAKDRKRS